MKKRLRKKYRVGEFRELSFSFSFEYKGDVNSDACGEFLNELVNNCIAAQGLDCDGYMTAEGCRLVLSASNPCETSDAHRAAVKTWLDSRDDIDVSEFTELEDLWYSCSK